MKKARRIMLELEYDGTSYAGWQRQKTGVTIQGVLEEVLERICGEKISVTGASRTDAGVHALGQVCHFETTSKISCASLAKGINGLLRPFIVTRTAKEVSARFHARYSATGKEYAYFVLNRPFPSAQFHPFVEWVRIELDDGAMDEACRYITGKVDFTSFQASAGREKSPVVELRRARCFRGTGKLYGGRRLPFGVFGDDLVTFHFEARNFLHHMVRNLVGTLLEIGQNKRKVHEMEKIVKARDRRAAGQLAPAKGLFLMRIHYPEELA